MKKLGWFSCLMIVSLLIGCTHRSEPSPGRVQETMVLYCPHSMDFYTPIVNEFEQRYNVKVKVVNAGTVEFLKRIEEEQDDPQGDVLWGGTISTVSTKSELFEHYISPNDQYLPEQYRNVEGNLTRFTNILSVLMVNTDLIGDIEITGYESLLDPRLKGKIAAADLTRASSGKEQLVNMLYAMGQGDPEAGWSYVKALCTQLDGYLLNSSSAVYTGVASGQYAVGLSFEEGAANYVNETSPIRIVYMKEGVIGKPDGVYIIKNAKNLKTAQKFVDFLISKEVQSIVSKQLNRRPLRTDVQPPESFPPLEEINIISEDPVQVEEKIDQWTQRFLALFHAASD